MRTLALLFCLFMSGCSFTVESLRTAPGSSVDVDLHGNVTDTCNCIATTLQNSNRMGISAAGSRMAIRVTADGKTGVMTSCIGADCELLVDVNEIPGGQVHARLALLGGNPIMLGILRDMMLTCDKK